MVKAEPENLRSHLIRLTVEDSLGGSYTFLGFNEARELAAQLMKVANVIEARVKERAAP